MPDGDVMVGAGGGSGSEVPTVVRAMGIYPTEKELHDFIQSVRTAPLVWLFVSGCGDRRC